MSAQTSFCLEGTACYPARSTAKNKKKKKTNARVQNYNNNKI